MSNYTELMTQARAHEKRAADAADPDEEMLAFQEARDAYAKALELQHEDARALYHLARCDLVLSAGAASDADDDDDASDAGDIEHMEAIDGAIEKMRKALSLKEKFGECMFSLAEALIARADLRVQMVEDGVLMGEDGEDEEDPEEVAVREAEKDLKEACEFFTKALPVFEASVGSKNDDGDDVTVATVANTLVGHSEALSSLAYLKNDANEYEALFDQAVALIGKAVEVNPERKSELLMEWASIYETRADKRVAGSEDDDVIGSAPIADYSDAFAKLDEAIAADTKFAPAYYERAQLLMSLAHQTLLHAAVSMDDDDANADKDLDELEYPKEVQEKVWSIYQDAKAALEKAAELDAESGEITQRLGDLCFTMSRLEMEVARASRADLTNQAESWFRKTLALDADDADAVARLAQAVFFAQGGDEGKKERDTEVEELLTKFKDLGADLEDLLDEPEVYEEEFVARASSLFPEQADQWEDDDSDEDDE